jgi:hypothetical protein
MGILTIDMKRVVEQQRLGFFATVCPDGTPNLSPKGAAVATRSWSTNRRRTVSAYRSALPSTPLDDPHFRSARNLGDESGGGVPPAQTRNRSHG